MKIFTAEQIREIDKFTILHEPVASIDLMERAASAISEWIIAFVSVEDNILCVCGAGNNGGDGFALTRLLLDKGYNVKAAYFSPEEKMSLDAKTNFDRLIQKYPDRLMSINNSLDLSETPTVIIDAIFGSGLSRPVLGNIAEIIKQLNDIDAVRIAIDIPSGLFGENNGGNHGAIFKAHHTLSIQCPSLSFYFSENESYCGKVQLVPIGLHPDAMRTTETPFNLLEDADIEQMIPKRGKFSHKGNYGHALLVAGSYGKMGAAVLSSKACLRTGVGLITTHIPVRGYDIMQISVPENMVSIDDSEYYFTGIKDVSDFNAIAVGPGLGVKSNTIKGFQHLIEHCEGPFVLDADALNIISVQKDLLQTLPKNTILTPHIGEFKRLFGETLNSYERLMLQIEKSVQLQIIIVCKGAHTIITDSNGNVYINITGNCGMATAGSGDVLTGIILSLLSQHYQPIQAAIAGVYIHGLAGDCASGLQSYESLIAGDIIESIGDAFKRIIE
jgi:NAD(P)H-hydrate epimerase